MSREQDAFRAMMSVIVVGLIMLFSSGIFESQLSYVHTGLVKRLLLEGQCEVTVLSHEWMNKPPPCLSAHQLFTVFQDFSSLNIYETFCEKGRS